MSVLSYHPRMSQINTNLAKLLFYHSKNDQESFENKLWLAEQNFNLKLSID